MLVVRNTGSGCHPNVHSDYTVQLYKGIQGVSNVYRGRQQGAEVVHGRYRGIEGADRNEKKKKKISGMVKITGAATSSR